MVIGLIFALIFAVVAMLLWAATASDAKQRKKTLSRLEELARGPQNPENDEGPLSVKREEHSSGLPWLDRLLAKADLQIKLRLLLYQAGLKWTPSRLVLMSACAGMACGYLVYLRTGSMFLAPLTAAGGGWAPFLFVAFKRNSRFMRFRQLLPDALDMMVSAMRAGHSLTSAMDMVAKEAPDPIKPEFRQCVDEQSYGLEMRAAMANLAYRVPLQDIRIISAAILIQKDTGGNLTEILERVGYLIREDFRLQRQIATHTAQGRMTGWILSLLPAILGFLLYLMNPERMSVMWTTKLGVQVLCTSVVMTAIGALIIRKIVRPRV